MCFGSPKLILRKLDVALSVTNQQQVRTALLNLERAQVEVIAGDVVANTGRWKRIFAEVETAE